MEQLAATDRINIITFLKKKENKKLLGGYMSLPRGYIYLYDNFFKQIRLQSHQANQAKFGV